MLARVAGSAQREQRRGLNAVGRSGYMHVISNRGGSWGAKINLPANLRGNRSRTCLVLSGQSAPELAVAGDIAAIWRDVHTGVGAAGAPGRYEGTNLPRARWVGGQARAFGRRRGCRCTHVPLDPRPPACIQVPARGASHAHAVHADLSGPAEGARARAARQRCACGIMSLGARGHPWCSCPPLGPPAGKLAQLAAELSPPQPSAPQQQRHQRRQQQRQQEEEEAESEEEGEGTEEEGEEEDEPPSPPSLPHQNRRKTQPKRFLGKQHNHQASTQRQQQQSMGVRGNARQGGATRASTRERAQGSAPPAPKRARTAHTRAAAVAAAAPLRPPQLAAAAGSPTPAPPRPRRLHHPPAPAPAPPSAPALPPTTPSPTELLCALWGACALAGAAGAGLSRELAGDYIVWLVPACQTQQWSLSARCSPCC